MYGSKTTVGRDVHGEGDALLRITDLHVSYAGRHGHTKVVHGISLTVNRAETVAVVGESGSGKSTVARAVLRLLPGNARVVAGNILLDGTDLGALGKRAIQRVRGKRIGFIPQDPATSLDPLLRVGSQLIEAIRIHEPVSRKGAAERAIRLLDDAGLSEPERRMVQYPHEMSGGMRQRVLIAMAQACSPDLIVADEPTSALDVTVQKRILDRLQTLAAGRGTALLVITHDLAMAAERASRIVVMKNGRIIESGSTSRLVSDPQHEYTRALLDASVTARATTIAAGDSPDGKVLLSVRKLRKRFAGSSSAKHGGTFVAVDGVSFDTMQGKTLGIVGESGSGKSTTARIIMRLESADAGEIELDGSDLLGVSGRRLQRLRSKFQLVQQNPYASLDPRWTVEQIVGEPLRLHKRVSSSHRASLIATLLTEVGLDPALARRRPAEMSGGQQQRVAIARAIAVEPELLVLDEAVSALDSTTQATVLNLLVRLQKDHGLTYIFISHDLGVVRQISHHVVVLKAGRLVEAAPTAQLFDHPSHPYTRELLAAIPGSHLSGSARCEPLDVGTRSSHRHKE